MHEKDFSSVLGSCIQLKSEYMMHFFVIAGNHDNYGDVKVIIFYKLLHFTFCVPHTKERPSFLFLSSILLHTLHYIKERQI